MDHVEHESTSKKEGNGEKKQENPDLLSDLQVGDWVEVFSKSQKAWCLGLVTWRGGADVNVVFQLPGAGPDEWVEKRPPLGCKEIRNMGSDAVTNARPTNSWTAAEEVAYKQHFNALTPFNVLT